MYFLVHLMLEAITLPILIEVFGSDCVFMCATACVSPFRVIHIKFPHFNSPLCIATVVGPIGLVIIPTRNGVRVMNVYVLFKVRSHCQ